MPCPVIKSGQVVRLKLPDSVPEPRRNKYCLCLCADESLFFIINTHPFKHAPVETQIKVYKSQMDFLDHDSYLDASKLKNIPIEIVESGIKKDGIFSPSVEALKHLKCIIAQQPYLAMRHIKILQNNFP